MKDKVASYEESQYEEEQSVLRDDIDMKDLETLGTLGKGSFGHVTLVKWKKSPDGETFALKAVSKAQIVETGQQGHIMSEKKVMSTMKHPFLVCLHATFKDADRLYFLLDPILGGELFTILRKRRYFSEDTARFYAAHVVDAFQYMHDRDTVYRDLKPENLLLDSDGYMKVTDFGFAKKLRGRTWTLCGTPDYLAPEIVGSRGHGKGVDYWTLGVLIYEMLASFPPFYDEDPMKTYAKIMHGKIKYPSHFSKEAVSLVKKLLNRKPTKRLGVVKGGAKNIKDHAWFKRFRWDKLENGTMKAPIIIPIKDKYDLSNFEEYPEEENEWGDYEDDGSGWDATF
jgi:serine/threonine protein kinase